MPPEAGDRIFVHRKDGGTSQHTIAEIRNQHYDTGANRVFTVNLE